MGLSSTATPTQIEAFKGIEPFIPTIKARIRAFYRALGPLTRDEVYTLYLRQWPTTSEGSLRPRMSELIDDFTLVPTGKTRITRAGGQAEVLRLRKDDEPGFHREKQPRGGLNPAMRRIPALYKDMRTAFPVEFHIREMEAALADRWPCSTVSGQISARLKIDGDIYDTGRFAYTEGAGGRRVRHMIWAWS